MSRAQQGQVVSASPGVSWDGLVGLEDVLLRWPHSNGWWLDAACWVRAQLCCWPGPWFFSTWLACASHNIVVSGELGFVHSGHLPPESKNRSCQAFSRLRTRTGQRITSDAFCCLKGQLTFKGRGLQKCLSARRRSSLGSTKQSTTDGFCCCSCSFQTS